MPPVPIMPMPISISLFLRNELFEPRQYGLVFFPAATDPAIAAPQFQHQAGEGGGLEPAAQVELILQRCFDFGRGQSGGEA